MPKLIWEKKLQEAVKRQQRFGWSVREKRGKVLVQRYYPETNKLQKNIKERRIVREARSGEDFDLIATLNFDNSFKVVCNFEDYQEKQTVEEQEKKVIDKLKKVPDDMQRILSVMLHRFNKSETAAATSSSVNTLPA